MLIVTWIFTWEKKCHNENECKDNDQEMAKHWSRREFHAIFLTKDTATSVFINEMQNQMWEFETLPLNGEILL